MAITCVIALDMYFTETSNNFTEEKIWKSP